MGVGRGMNPVPEQPLVVVGSTGRGIQDALLRRVPDAVGTRILLYAGERGEGVELERTSAEVRVASSWLIACAR